VSPDLAASCPAPTPLQANPYLELGAPEPHENRGPRRLRKSPAKVQVSSDFFRQRYRYHPKIFCLKPYLHGIKRFFLSSVVSTPISFVEVRLEVRRMEMEYESGERRMGKRKKKKKEPEEE
jgi:hypothetical protein